MMKKLGKPVLIPQNNFTSEPEFLCLKHPLSSHVGVCALCLRERLLKLVCPNCGQRRISSCSCSLTADVAGHVYPISLLIHNEDLVSNVTQPRTKNHARHPLKRSSSTCMDGRRSSFWNLGWFSRRRTECTGWELDHVGRPQINELAKDWEMIKKRSSGLKVMRSASIKEDGGESDSEFFDLNVEMLSSKARPGLRENRKGVGVEVEVVKRATSCRITVNEMAGRGGKKGIKVLRWMFKKQHD